MFLGFGPEAFWWFDGLERDNSRDYFEHAQRATSTSARCAASSRSCCSSSAAATPRSSASTATCASPRTSGLYKELGTYGHAGRLFVQLSSRGLYVGTGYYRVEPDQLERFRAAVDDDQSGPLLEAALAKARLDVDGASLKTAPRGYPATTRGSSCCGASS